MQILIWPLSDLSRRLASSIFASPTTPSYLAFVLTHFYVSPLAGLAFVSSGSLVSPLAGFTYDVFSALSTNSSWAPRLPRSRYLLIIGTKRAPNPARPIRATKKETQLKVSFAHDRFSRRIARKFQVIKPRTTCYLTSMKRNSSIQGSGRKARCAQLWTVCSESLRVTSHSSELRQTKADCDLASSDVQGA
jgi:hypothetical protein